MPRVLVTNDDGDVFWSESVQARDFKTNHFRGCLADRLGWAVADAEGPAPTNVRPIDPAPAPETPGAFDASVVTEMTAA